MRKFLAIFLSALYVISMQACFAVENLYFLKNTDKNTILPIVESAFSNNKKYTVVKKNPYLATSTKNNSNYMVIILQPSSNNLFYYFQSNDSDKTDKIVKKNAKNTEYCI